MPVEVAGREPEEELGGPIPTLFKRVVDLGIEAADLEGRARLMVEQAAECRARAQTLRLGVGDYRTLIGKVGNLDDVLRDLAAYDVEGMPPGSKVAVQYDEFGRALYVHVWAGIAHGWVAETVPNGPADVEDDPPPVAPPIEG